MVILGFSHGHDSGAALYIDGEIIVSISDERLSRHKKGIGLISVTLPTKSIDYCLNYANLNPNDVDYYMFNVTQHRPNVVAFMKYHYGIESSKLKYVSHHLSHAAMSVLTSNFDECGVVISDTMGEDVHPDYYGWDFFKSNGFNLVTPEDPNLMFVESWTLLHFKDGRFLNVENNFGKMNRNTLEMVGDVSIGYKYSSGADQLVGGITIGNAGRLMGLSSFADKRWVNNQERHHTIIDDKLTIKKEPFFPNTTINSSFQDKANVAGLYQREQEECSQFLVEKVKRWTNCDNITVGGGSFLNCNTNTNIVKSGLFDGCHFFAPSDDSGTPLGCALYGALNYDKPNRKDFFSPYLGRPYTKDEIIKDLSLYPDLSVTEFENYDELINFVTDTIINNKTVGWFQGGSELGPRALGNRSILANPSCPWMTDYINSEIKKREWFRPFAPSVLYEHQSDIFDLDYFSPYMLLTAEVKEEWRGRIPAVTHVDNTSRYQSVTIDTNERYYRLINDFYKKTGVPMLLNTSFNGPSEPIVESPKDALNTFFNIGLDLLVIGDFVIMR